MSGGYWPWWLGAAALAGVTVGASLVTRRPFGVSGIVGRLANLRAEREVERKRAAVGAMADEALEAALARATAEAFGALAAEATGGVPAAGPVPPGDPAAPPAGPSPTAGGARPSLGAHAVFLGAIVAGACLASLATGRFHLTVALSEDYVRLVAGGVRGLATLLAGGVLVGLGTALSGGCSTGHGLSGCARLQPAGLAASVTYFGVAALCSLLLAGRLA